MAINLNSVNLVGRLAADPDAGQLSSGTDYCSLRLAVNHGNDADGNERPASFFDVKTYGKTAAACGSYLAKGKLVAVSGELRQRSWETEDGSKRYVVEIFARQVEFLSPKDSNGEAPATTPSGATKAQGELPSDASDDDIPF